MTVGHRRHWSKVYRHLAARHHPRRGIPGVGGAHGDRCGSIVVVVGVGVVVVVVVGVGRLAGWLAGWLAVGRSVGWLAGWLADWLCCCLDLSQGPLGL